MSNFTDKLKTNSKAYKTAREAEPGLPNIKDGTYVAKCTPSCGCYNNGAPYVAFDFVILEGQYQGLQLKGPNGVSHYLDPESSWFSETLARVVQDLKTILPDSAEDIANAEIEDLEDFIKDGARTCPVVEISVKRKKKKSDGSPYLAIRITKLASDEYDSGDEDETEEDEPATESDSDELVPEVGDKVTYAPEGGRKGTYKVTEVDMDNSTVVLSNGKKNLTGVNWVDFEYVTE